MTGLLALVGCTAVVVAYDLARREASDFLDVQLRQVALNAGLGLADADAPPAADQDPEDPIVVTIWKDGVVARNDLSENGPGRPQLTGYADVTLLGHAWRTYTTGNSVWTVRAAQRDVVRREFARSAAVGAAAPILLLIPLSWIVVGWAMNRVLGRLDALARDVAKRSASAAAPLPLVGIPAEVAPLIEAMNGLIVRLRAAVDLQKRFLADAAHELRTPLAAVQVHVGDLDAAAPEERGARKADIARSVARASALVGELLRLAQLDASERTGDDAVDLAILLLDCVSDEIVMAEGKGVDLGVDVASSAALQGSETELRILLTNLIDNAVRYTAPGGEVDVGLWRTDEASIIEVLDTGCGLPPGSEAHIFDRFFRAAPLGVDGSGLGLAIARRIADRHGLALSVENRGDGRTGVRARLVVPH